MDVAPIVIAVISLVGSVIATGITTWVTLYSDQRKQKRQTDRIIAKSRDPIFVSAQDLQARLYNITELGMVSWYVADEYRRTNLERYTCFLFGQYLSWVYILRREGTLRGFLSDKSKRDFNHVLDRIAGTLTDTFAERMPFKVCREQQAAIGELMTVKEERQDGSELYCIGFASFSEKWEKDATFKSWFAPLLDGVQRIGEAYQEGKPIPDNRLRRVQHLLMKLVLLIDVEHIWTDPKNLKLCTPAPKCQCNLEACVSGRRGSGRSGGKSYVVSPSARRETGYV